jgi:hypothetical protein
VTQSPLRIRSSIAPMAWSSAIPACAPRKGVAGQN